MSHRASIHEEPAELYEPPILEGPAELYEPPLLLDVEDLAGCNWGCVTSGSSGGGGGGGPFYPTPVP